MVLADRALVCLAVFLIHGVDQVTAERRWGRLARRDVSNTTISTTSASESLSDGINVSTLSSVANTAAEYATLRATVGDANDSSESSEASFTIHGLESVTTNARPVPTSASQNLASITTRARPVPTAAQGLNSVTTYSRLIPSSTLNSESSDAISLPIITTAVTNSPSNSQAVSTGLAYSNVSSASSQTISESPSFRNTSTAVKSLMTSLVNGTSYAPAQDPSTYTTPNITIYTPPSGNSPDGINTNVVGTDGTSVRSCDVTTNPDFSTVWSTIHTWTITWTGPPESYTPPYPETTTTPVFCPPIVTGRLSISIPASTGENRKPPSSATAVTSIFPIATPQETPTITFWTTDKNPAVVYSTNSAPNYGDTGATKVQDHSAPGADGGQKSAPNYGQPATTPPNAIVTPAPGATYPQQGPSPTPTQAVTVIIQTTRVVINGETFTDNPQSKTSTVVVQGNTYTINPSQVIGAGATVTRPPTGGVFVPTVPVTSTTSIAGLQIVYGASVATIDGTAFTIGNTPSTVMVKGQAITLGPGGIFLPSATIPPVKAIGPTEAAVLGGHLITAIGKSVVVIEGTTINYGPGLGATSKIIDGDTILIGPSGVSVHGVTLGGPTAVATATTYEIVGGATVTKLGGSAIVIGGTTYAIGDAATTAITTVIGGQTLTIGPSGVSQSTYTFAEPYITSTVIQPGKTSAVAAATKSGESAGLTLRPKWDLGIMAICIAIGVEYLGLLS